MRVFSILLIIIGLSAIFNKIPVKIGKKRNIAFFLTLVAFVLILAFRNAINVDYINYTNLYNKIWDQFNSYGLNRILSFSYHFDEIEVGYALLNIIVRFVFNDVKWVFLISAILIVYPLWRFFDRFPLLILSVFFYLLIGTYFEGFNIMRQMIAASLFLFSYSYLKKGSFIKYSMVCLISFLFHSSALIMIPAYFVLRLGINDGKKRSIKRKFILFSLGLIAIFSISYLTSLYIINFKGGSYDYINGISSISWKNAIVPMGCFLIAEVLFNCNSFNDESAFLESGRNIDASDMTILENGSIMWAILQLCKLQIALSTRFASFFAPFILVFLSISLGRQKNAKVKAIVIFGVVVSLLLFEYYQLYEGSPLNNYEFIWFNS